MRKTIQNALFVAFIVAALVGSYIFAEAAGLNAELFTALATALAAIFAGWSALQSSRAARESTNTAREARRAVGLAMKPRISAYITGYDESKISAQLIVPPLSSYPIGGAEVAWTLRDGRTGKKSVGAMQPAPSPWNEIPIGAKPTGPGTDTLTVTYWGADPTVKWSLTSATTVGENGLQGDPKVVDILLPIA